MLKSIAAVLLGYLVFAVPAGLLFIVSGQDPHLEPTLAFEVGSVVYGMVFAFIGGWISGIIANRNEVRHAIGVGVIILILAVISIVVQIGKGSMWSQLSTIFLMVPSAVFGGYVRQRTKKVN